MDVDTSPNRLLTGLDTATNPLMNPDSADFQGSNGTAAALNAETSLLARAIKPNVALANAVDAPSTVKINGRVPLQQNGDRRPEVEMPVNGLASGGEMDQNTSTSLKPSPQPLLGQNLVSSTESEALPSSLPASTSLDSYPHSSSPTDTQPSEATQPPPQGFAKLAADTPQLPSTTSQAPVANLRTSPQPFAETPATALRIKSEKQQQRLARDPNLAEQFSVEIGGPVQNTSTLPSFEVNPAPQQHPDEGVEMDFSYEAPPVANIKLSSPPAQSPPPAPRPAPATLPAERPSDPTPAPTASAANSSAQGDQQMVDVHTVPGKITREREDDGADQPHAKRTKTGSESAEPEFKVPDLPQIQPPIPRNGHNATTSTAKGENDKTNPVRLAHMKKIISNLKKGNSSVYFRTPVDPVALNIPTYSSIIKHPMDLGTIDMKLKKNQYSTVKQFVDDFDLIVNNAVAFNGQGHTVTEFAQKMKGSFDNQMQNMPRAGVAEPTKEEKKARKVKDQPTRAIPARRQSIPTASPSAGSARSPTATTPAQTFALGPEGVPLIRRDSNVADGRPKRAIHPPKRRDDFGGGRPKKKKYEWQLKFCREVLTELKKPKHQPIAQFFYDPVDPIALNIPTYHSVIKKPMDLGTVEQKLNNNEYERAKDFEDDVRLIFKNCFKFNPKGEYVHQCGEDLQKIFEGKWETKDEWLAAHEPTSEPQSPGDDEEEEEDDSEEEEEDDSEAERAEKLQQLQKQIEQMSKQMGELAQPKKKKKPTPPAASATKKGGKAKGGKKDKQQATFQTSQASTKDKKKPAKAKAEKERFVSYTEKQYISTGISQLPDNKMNEALRIIQSNVPALKNTHETEIELDIDELPNHVLLKLLTFVKKYVPSAPAEPVADTYVPPSVTAPSKPKKNKPMSKHEQEAQIEELRGKLGAYNGGPISPQPHRSIEHAVDSSADEDDSEESEEE